MANRILSIVEIEELIKGIDLFILEGNVLHVHMDGNYLGVPVENIYLESNTNKLLEFRNAKFWLSYYRKRKRIHLRIM